MQFRCFFILLLVCSPVFFAQQKITIEDIYGGVFQPQGMEEFQSLKKNNQYTVLNYETDSPRIQIDLYDFASLKKVATLFDTKNYSRLPRIESYSFDPSERLILLATNVVPIYRYSFTADYFIYDLDKKELTRLVDTPIQEPTFSPDGRKIAFAKGNNLYLYDIASKATIALTNDGKKNEIINGICDWVYEEEFAFVKAFDWSADSEKIAYIRFDESQVPEFSMSVFANGLYPSIETIKYPKAGEKNALVSLHIYDVQTKETQKVNLDHYTDFYIPRIKWTNDAHVLSAKILNRHQNNLDLLFVNAKSGGTKVVLNETNKKYIDFVDNDNLTFLKDNQFIWTSEKDGFNHIYLYDKTGKLIRQITKGNWEVTQFYGLDEKNQNIYYESVENGTINRDVYRIGLDGGKKTRLSKNTGTNKATFSPDYNFYINSFSSFNQPTVYSLNDAKTGKELQIIENNEDLKLRLKAYDLPTKEFFTLKTVQNVELNAWMIKPNDFDASKKYPVLMYQYSGPGSQQVKNDWKTYDDYWFMMLAQQGYIVACVDGRGTGFKGEAFKKVTYTQLGKYELEDQMEAAKVLGAYPYIDANRIGIFGWSFGGFMASNAILKGNSIFKLAIAVAPVTNWRFYDTIYTERYMQTPQENPTGYDDNSPINFADQLKGNYLLIHGSSDDNVHVQNSMLMMESLIQANKPFDSQIYPDKNHGIYGGNTRIHLYHKMTNFIKERL
ncbi:S9 family peptidase [Flavobacterium faecale]|uniref:S9 family peptidase n=1 Tax=Flavobacterium faecale TaxID=1355330 RepID=UPI003AAFD1BA